MLLEQEADRQLRLGVALIQFDLGRGELVGAPREDSLGDDAGEVSEAENAIVFYKPRSSPSDDR